MRFILLMLMFICPMLTYGQAIMYRDKSDFADNSGKGEVIIEFDNATFRQGDIHRIKYTFRNIRGSYAVYNWQFSSLVPLPGELAIYDFNKRHIGDLISWSGGSRGLVSDDNWTFLHDGEFLGTLLQFRAGIVPHTRHRSMSDLLPPGTYYIQLILYKAFKSENPFRFSGDKVDFYKTFDKSELCRSNVLKIEIIGN